MTQTQLPLAAALTDALREEMIALITERATHVEAGVTCSGGETATTYLDIPKVLGDSRALQLAARLLRNHLRRHGMENILTAIGGPTTGSIPLVLSVATYSPRPGLNWFVVRDHAKEHGLGRILVGAEIGPRDTVILTDDVVSSGDSMIETIEKVAATGAQILAVMPLVHRGGAQARMKVEGFGIPYLPVLTHDDLGLPPLGAR